MLTFRSTDETIYDIGCDEVGRGSLFGRVYVAAVVLPRDDAEFDYSLLRDSKTFSTKNTAKIRNVAALVRKHALAYSVAWESAAAIDEINILQATQRAVHRAIAEVRAQMAEWYCAADDTLLIVMDGNYFKPFTVYNKATTKFDQIRHVCAVGGDDRYLSVAAASILAKVARDEYIAAICDRVPALDEIYGLRSNKGYGAAAHMAAVREAGRSPWHRVSFNPCRDAALCERFDGIDADDAV